MNVELKGLLSVVFLLAKLIIDLVEKKGSSDLVLDVEQMFAQLPGLVSNFPHLQEEIKSLDHAANLDDLLAFIGSQFVGLDSDVKAKAIMNASLKLVSDLSLDGYQLYTAIKG